MTENDSRGGRPRKYDGVADRVRAFRKNLGQNGYKRKEVLMSPSVEEEITRIAALEGVSTIDAASAMLEFGLASYTRSYVREFARTLDNQVGRGAESSSAGQLSLMGNAASASETVGLECSPKQSELSMSVSGTNPVKDFFNRRHSR